MSNQPPRPLTERQNLLLKYISTSIKERGYPPTLREMKAYMGLNSTNGVSDHLRALQRKGYLRRTHLKSRAISLTVPEKAGPKLFVVADTATKSQPSPSEATERRGFLSRLAESNMPHEEHSETVSVPLIGRVIDGLPILAVEGQRPSVKVDRFLIGANTSVFAVRLTGNSMYEAGVHDGDFIFVRKQEKARPGDIVLATYAEDAMIRYYFPEGERICLQPGNHRMEATFVTREYRDKFKVLGVVVFVYRACLDDSRV